MTPLLSGLLLLAAAPRVSTVVVYPDRAQVTRELTLPCGPKAVATFEGLPPAADSSSFRARVDVGTVEGLRAEKHAREQPFAAERQQLDDQLRALDQQIAAERQARERSDQLAKMAARYDAVAVSLVDRELSAPKPDVKAWATAFDTALALRLQAASEAVAADGRQRELERRRDELQRHRSRLDAAAGRAEYRADVQVSCPAGQKARVELSYMVGGASWEPSYEARADEAGGAVELSTFATLRQSTGEDWSQTRLFLSTAQPLQNATPPELRQLRVYAEKAEEKKVLVRREEYQEHAEAGEAANRPATPQGLAAAPQGLSVQLRVPEASDVPGDGRPARVFVGKARMPAHFAFRAAPKLVPFVYRVADLDNTGAFPLLPGPLDAFRPSGFIGRYGIQRVPQGGRFHLTFGLEEGIRVKRTVAKEVELEAGLFNDVHRFHYDYLFELANHRSRPEVVELSEHVPVSELEDVTVAFEEKTTPGYELKAEDGLATWKVHLAPGETKKLELTYRVDVPSRYVQGSP